jgi:hypothetical protein
MSKDDPFEGINGKVGKLVARSVCSADKDEALLKVLSKLSDQMDVFLRLSTLLLLLDEPLTVTS